MSGARPKLVVYTALVGPKEALNNPLALLPADATTDLDLEFVCLTDDRTLRSEVWRFEYLSQAHLPPEKLSRRPKALPHLYFAQATHSMYIDNTVAFKRLPCAADLATSQPYLFRAFKHARHTQLAQEVHAIAALGYEDADIICQQMDFYAQRLPLAEISPLTTGTVLLREHSHPLVQAFGQIWFENVLAFAKRDQLAFDFALRQSGAQIDYLPGITRDNAFIQWTGSLSPARLRASFDAKRYAWRHRQEPEALRDPKAHALAHQRGGEPAYQRPLRLLEVLCHQQGSSLGTQVSPRRGVADALEPLLTPWRQSSSRFVLARVQGLGPQIAQRFEPDECDAAGRALANFLGAQAQGTVLELNLAELTDLARVYTAGAAPAHDVMLVLGLPGEALAAGVHKLVRLLNPARGALALVLASPAPLAQAVEAEAVLQRWLGRAVPASLQAARHDGLDGPMANAMVSLSW